MTDRSTLQTFAARLDARGADLDRWPSAEAEQARGLIAGSTDARELAAQAAQLDAIVARAAEAEMPNGLAFRIVADVSSRRTDRFEWLVGSPRRLGFAGAGLSAAAVAVGILLGATIAPQASDYSNAGSDLGPAFAVALADDDL